jgi:hypothetical protein
MAQLSCLVFTAAILLSQAPDRDGAGVGRQLVPGPSRSAARSKVQLPDEVVLKAIMANPVCAPYSIKTSFQKGVVVISGRVGSVAVHDLVVRTAIEVGYPFRDDLKIDTADVGRVSIQEYPPYTGFEPPHVSYPPEWKRPARSQPAPLIRIPVAPNSVASPERQKALLEDIHRQVATPEVRAQILAESPRVNAPTKQPSDDNMASGSRGTSNIVVVGLLVAVSLSFAFMLFLLSWIIATCGGYHNAAAKTSWRRGRLYAVAKYKYEYECPGCGTHLEFKCA